MEEKELIPEETRKPRLSVWKALSRILSVVFNPFLVPLFSFAMMFLFTYLNIMPLEYVLFVMSVVVTFTLLTPFLFISIYRWMNKWTWAQLTERKNRSIPYLLTIMSYATCLFTMYKLHFPPYFSNIIVATLIVISCCAVLNLFWKISIHMAGCGMFIGGLIAYSLLFYFNPIWWLSGFILLSGFQGTALISYHRHTLREIIMGFVVGLFCGIIGILFI